MSEPRATDIPGVIQVKIYGAVAADLIKEMTLGKKKFDPGLQNRFIREKMEEIEARKSAGLNLLIPDERLPFSQLHKKGIPNVCVGELIREIMARGYRLIAADYEVDDKNRDVVRFALSRKEEDRELAVSSPTVGELSAYFEEKVWQYVHIHDHRRIHAGTGQQVGNNVIDLLGTLQRPDKCATYKVLHFHNRAEVMDDLYSYELVRHGNLERPPSRPLTYRLGEQSR